MIGAVVWTLGAAMMLHLSTLFAPLVLGVVVGRMVAKWLGVGATSLAFGVPLRQSATTGLLLLPMAGLAIGLVNTTVTLFPLHGGVVSSIVLAAVAAMETIGPPIASRALRWSGDELRGEHWPDEGTPH